MISDVLVVAPHPDDETLSCGGTLLKLKDSGCQLHWLIVTCMNEAPRVSRDKEIESVAKAFGFDSVSCWEITTTTVDTMPFGELVCKASNILAELKPSTLLLPFCNDVHTDHYYTSKAFLSCCKWFRHPYITHVLFYETISETDFNINPTDTPFLPNIYVDISQYFHKKMEILNIYKSELGDFPFPRSPEAIESLARLRGSQCGAEYAEVLCLLRSVF